MSPKCLVSPDTVFANRFNLLVVCFDPELLDEKEIKTAVNESRVAGLQPGVTASCLACRENLPVAVSRFRWEWWSSSENRKEEDKKDSVCASDHIEEKKLLVEF